MDHPSTPPAGSGAPLAANAFTSAGVARGMRAMLPVVVPVFVFGVAFTITARTAGMQGWEVLAMSASVFAGASQFAVLDLWHSPVPWVPLLLATFAVNARHLLLGASLYPWCRSLPPGQLYGAMTVLSDPNWAATVVAQARGERDLGHLFGGGIMLWLVWMAGTTAGLAAGHLDLADIKRFGLDAVFICFFACTLVGLRRGRVDDLPWLVAAGAALAAMWWLPANWHVLVGGLAGGLAGLVQRELRR